MEASGFEMATYVGKRRTRLIGDADCAPVDRAINVEHPEPDPFHVEGPNRHGERRALGEERGRGVGSWLRLNVRDEDLQTVFRRFPVIDAR
jgi:hypothetical protein